VQMPRPVGSLPVCPSVKPVGEPDALIGHVRFDERGWETGCRPLAPSYRAHPRLYRLRRLKRGKAGLLCPCSSGLDLFRNRESVIDLYPKIADSALNLGVTQEQLHGAQVASAAVNKCRIAASSGIARGRRGRERGTRLASWRWLAGTHRPLHGFAPSTRTRLVGRSSSDAQSHGRRRPRAAPHPPPSGGRHRTLAACYRSQD
jgi:hypothetical protein